MAEIMLRSNRVYGKFYDRNIGNKIYRANFGRKFSDVAFKRARDAIAYRSRVFMRYANLSVAHRAWLAEQNKVSTRWIDRLLARIKVWILWLKTSMIIHLKR
jgi:hypothetical protein